MSKLSEEEYNRVRKNIVKKLYSVKAFRKGHLLLQTLQKGIPSHLVGFVKDVLKELIKEEIVVCYGKTKYRLAYQLNIKRLKEIEEIVFG